MVTAILPLVVILILTAGLIYLFGEYIAWIYLDEASSRGESAVWLKTDGYLDKLFTGIEKIIYRLIGLDPEYESNWLGYLTSLLLFNLLLFILIYLIFAFQGYLPLNPLNLEGMSWDLAYHTASTFTANTNQQHYGGEILSYFSQIFGVGLAMFLSAATGLALAPAFTRGIINEEEEKLGNFFRNVVKGTVRFLLPLALLLALFLISQGAPQWFGGEIVAETLEGVEQTIRRGPVAGIEAIKMIGTNGGGYFAANAAHPYENPTIMSNVVLNLVMLAVPIAVIYAFGVWIGKRRHGVILITALFVIFLGLLGLSVWGEGQPNQGVMRAEGEVAVDQAMGNMEGKEVRFGTELSALWAVSTTASPPVHRHSKQYPN